jgi:DNA-binding IclR family transcriptional regulator
MASAKVKSGARTLEILDLLASARDPHLTLSSISRLLELPKSSTAALLQTLLQYSFVAFDENTRTYSLGIRTFEVGSAYLRALTGEEIIRRELRRLASSTRAASHFAALDGAEIVYLFREQPETDIRLDVAIGSRIPAVFTSLGKAILATLPTDVVEGVLAARWTPRTSKSLVDPDKILQDLGEIATRGYAIDDEESNLGIICFGAPVHNPGQRAGAAGAVSATLLKAQLSPRDYDRIPAAVIECAARLSQASSTKGSLVGTAEPSATLALTR